MEIFATNILSSPPYPYFITTSKVAKQLALEQQQEQEMTIIADTFRTATLQALCFCRWSDHVLAVVYRQYSLTQLRKRMEKTFTRIHFGLWRTALLIHERSLALESIRLKQQRCQYFLTWRRMFDVANKVGHIPLITSSSRHTLSYDVYNISPPSFYRFY